MAWARCILILFVAPVAFLPVLAAPAGWSADPAQNLPIADRTGDQVQVEIAPTLDGGCYVSWYDNAAGGYDVALQRLDAAGVEQWPHNGIIVADTSFDWVTDYSLAVDKDDEALLAFRDDRSGSEEISAARIAPDGTPLWGPTGLQFSSGGEVGPPRITSTNDDRVVVAWAESNVVKLRRLDLAGHAEWPADIAIADPAGATQFLADLQPSSDGGVIVSWVHTASFYAPRHLYAQRFTRDGVPLWGEADASGGRTPLVIFDSGTLQYGNFPPFVPDGSGGAVFAWYETDPLLQVRVQHVRADGTTLFPTNGALSAVERIDRERVEPAMAYDAATQDIYVFWRETPVASGLFTQALYGQRFDAAGKDQWGMGGRLVEDWGSHEMTQLAASVFAGGVMFAYVDKYAEGDQRVWLRRFDRDGQDVWSPARVAVSAVASGKSRLYLTLNRAGFALLGWQDTRAGNEDIYLQNVNADGSLGVSPGSPTPPGSPTATETNTPAETPTLQPGPSPVPTETPSTAGLTYLPVTVRGGWR